MQDGEGFQNYLRLTLLLKEGTQLLRQLFRSQYKKWAKIDWEDNPEFARTFISTKDGKGIHKECSPNQKKLLESGDLNCWDISILSLIFT